MGVTSPIDADVLETKSWSPSTFLCVEAMCLRITSSPYSLSSHGRLVFWTLDWLTTKYDRIQIDGITLVGDWNGFSVFQLSNPPRCLVRFCAP